MIRLEKISRTYRIGNQSIAALDAIDLSIGASQFVAVMGRSGSGKSTLLNIIGCMDRPDAGSYYLEGTDIASMDDDSLSRVRNRCIGFVFQSFHLLPRLTTLENVLLPRRYHEMGIQQEDRQKAIALLRRVELEDRMLHKPGELSGGQRQRVAIARALINDPRVLLADEPTGNLDSSTAAAILALLQTLNDEGQTIVMVTHETDIAARAKRRIVMHDGRIERDDDAS